MSRPGARVPAALLLCLPGSALAEEIVTTWAVGAHHVYRVEAWSVGPIFAESATWRTVQGQAWGAVLDCTVVAPRVEDCRFGHDLAFWGFQERPGDAPEWRELRMPGSIEIVRNKVGHVVSFDVRGDRTSFWDDATAAKGRLHHSGQGVYKSPDDRRAYGQFLERAMARALLGALDLELAPKGLLEAPWVVTAMPSSGLRFDTNLGNARITGRKVGRDGDVVHVAYEGPISVTEATVSTSSSGGVPQEMALRAAADFGADGHVLRSEVVLAVTHPGGHHDHWLSRFAAETLPAVPDDAWAGRPGGPPEPPAR